MNILFTVCGRAGSKGIKNKNIRDFCGYPLMYYSLSVIDLIKSVRTDTEIEVVVNSDSKELLDLANNNPFFKLDTIRRCDELGGDQVAKIDVINDCYVKMKEAKGRDYDIVIDLDITSPLRTLADVQALLDKHIVTGADVTTSVTESRRNPYFNMVMKTDKGYKKVLASNYVTRQQSPEMFDMNASIYAYRPEYLITGKGVLDGYCECIQMYDTGVLDLDKENDFELMQVIAEHLFSSKKDFRQVRDNIRDKINNHINECRYG